MHPDAQVQFRQPPRVDDQDYVRVEWGGNKYYVPRAELVSKRRTWVAPVGFWMLFFAYVLVVLAITGRL